MRKVCTAGHGRERNRVPKPHNLNDATHYTHTYIPGSVVLSNSTVSVLTQIAHVEHCEKQQCSWIWIVHGWLPLSLLSVNFHAYERSSMNDGMWGNDKSEHAHSHTRTLAHIYTVECYRNAYSFNVSVQYLNHGLMNNMPNMEQIEREAENVEEIMMGRTKWEIQEDKKGYVSTKPYTSHRQPC